MYWVLKILAGVVVVWWWLLVGSRDHCPSCGLSLERDYGPEAGVSTAYISSSCPCGWRAP